METTGEGSYLPHPHLTLISHLHLQSPAVVILKVISTNCPSFLLAKNLSKSRMVNGCEVCIGTKGIKRLVVLCGLSNSRRKGEAWSRIKDGGGGKGTGWPTHLEERTTEKGYQRADV